jgi:hypothetical protein
MEVSVGENPVHPATDRAQLRHTALLHQTTELKIIELRFRFGSVYNGSEWIRSRIRVLFGPPGTGSISDSQMYGSDPSLFS